MGDWREEVVMTKQVKIGNKIIGGGNKILVQSMLNVPAENIEGSVLQAKALEQAGCEVAVVQSDNLNGESPWLPCVVQSANAWPADIFVSLHCNAANGQARGTETLAFALGGESEALAQCIQQQMVDTLGTVDRGVKERPDLCVLRRTDMPAALIEMAFIDNDEDMKLLTEQTDEIARAIARGVMDYEQEVIE